MQNDKRDIICYDFTLSRPRTRTPDPGECGGEGAESACGCQGSAAVVDGVSLRMESVSTTDGHSR